jgi:hypothetical protein
VLGMKPNAQLQRQPQSMNVSEVAMGSGTE